jgi:hypothetical protein
MAPAVGFEPTTNRLTADRSTTELRWICPGRLFWGTEGAANLAQSGASGKFFLAPEGVARGGEGQGRPEGLRLQWTSG